jgi:CDGSH-type Zn-finger protein
MTDTQIAAAIEVTQNGPYHVSGDVPLKRVRKVPSDHPGSFADWEVYEEIPTDGDYWLCRCGRSDTKPFCSGMHEKVGFDGTETAATTNYADRAKPLGGTNVAISDDRSICAHAAYCSNATTNIWKGAKSHDDDEDLAKMLVQMVDRCPSGALSYTVDGASGEKPLVQEIWVQEDGPYLLRGAIPITRSDGQPIEARNRMAVCRCGQSKNKPLCDGTHAEVGFTDG